MNQDMLNDKINREFLRLHINEIVTCSGTFVSYGYNGSLLITSCKYFDDLINTNIGIPHMWLQNIINKNEFLNLREGDIIFVTGTVKSYKNSDPTYSLKTTMGLTNCKIQSATQSIFIRLINN
ncbi:MAG: hypothetical protein PHG58_08260 [Clostridia bacterium]|nr:hypothetical protein [Clostridia bacterium]